MFEQDGTLRPALPSVDVTDFDEKIVYGAAIVGFLVNLNALLVPIFQHVGGGLVAGFIAGYAAGRPVRGAVWGTIAAGLTGVATGFLFFANYFLVGLFIEPPSLIAHFFGPISPWFTWVDFFGLLLLYIALIAVAAIDGLLVGSVSGFLKGLLRTTIGDE